LDFEPLLSATDMSKVKVPALIVEIVNAPANVPDFSPVTPCTALVTVDNCCPLASKTITVNVASVPDASVKLTVPFTLAVPPALWVMGFGENERFEMAGGVALELPPLIVPPPEPPPLQPMAAKKRQIAMTRLLMRENRVRIETPGGAG
jgi:hypothetical protein